MVRRNVFLSGSWDDTIKLWDLAHPASLATFKEHTYCVYAANWCGGLPAVTLEASTRPSSSVLIPSDSLPCQMSQGVSVCAGTQHMQTCL